ncbi:MarR family transcriptional regulator [Ornithinimicrobium faecis]|uniref:MarR family transcriptional regulator n=1 Tax=Ornithinimicrobium faecis TaxID=2934158 RepID=A0ABY4YUC6_9MICO|nr:MarR family transcriptional regulator [Ornithinimicrobium sp. HY1793]USQ80371.1 MarR family transcriptional regulator [Ornithinimicrobium sp. HY1793]
MADRVSDFLAQWAAERPDLDVTPMGVIGRLARGSELMSRGIQTYFVEHGLQQGQFDVLATLRRSGSPFTLTPGALADSTMRSQAAMTNRLAGLEAKGLIERKMDPDNRRSVLVSLTDEGLELVDRVVTGHVENERELLAPLTGAEQERLAGLLEKLLAGSGDIARD